MFSQSESIHARSWVPLQDSPAIRFTYDAHVSAPKDIRVVMSALNDAKHPLDGDFRFDQPHPIPSYLLAIAAGDIAVKETGPRSAVYAEPSVVGKAAHEFEDTEKMIETAEKLYGPYRWGRYDMLVLPPSFPFGGMENPNMTFATPTMHRRRQEPGQRGLARAGAFLVGQPGDRRRVARHLAQRGFHHLRAGPHHRGAVRQAPGRRGDPAVGARAAERHRRACRPTRRSWHPIRAGSARTIRCPTWPTTRARGSCARWSSASAARTSTHT